MKKTMKKALSLVLALAMLLTMANVLIVNANVDYWTTGRESAEVSNATNLGIVAENDYQTAQTGLDWSYFTQSSRDALPMVDPLDNNNIAMGYAHTAFGEGAIYLGAEYIDSDTNKIKNGAVKAVAGKTYVVEYDYYTKGKLANDLTVYLTAADTVKDTEGNFKLSYDAANVVNMLTFACTDAENGTDITGEDWIRNCKAVITLPEDFDTASYPYLIIGFKNGGNKFGAEKVYVYIDNVTVSATYTETYVEENVLFESDYNNVETGVSDCYSGYKNVGNNLYPSYEGANGYLYYKQSTMNLGVIRLGHSYANTSLTDYNYVEAVPGKTYKIAFDYRTAPYLDTTQYPNWPNSNLEVGIAVADPDISLYDGSAWMGPNAWKNGYTSYYEMIEDLTVTAGSCKPDTGWLNYELTFTVPENCDVTTNNALQIFFINGQRSGFYVDNIKVTTTEMVTGINLFESDFENAKLTELSNSHSDHFDAPARDIAPIADPDGNGIVLGYSHSYYAVGTAPLGYDFTNGTLKLDGSQYITAQAGATYTVYFDYRVSGTMRAWNSPLNIGISLANPVLKDSQAGTSALYANYLNDYTTKTWDVYSYNTVSVDTAIDTGWVSKKMTITIPEDADLSVNNSLQLYALGGGKVWVYFDNIKVVKVEKTEPAIAEDTVLFESDYNKVATGVNDCYTPYHSVSNNLYPTYDGANGYLYYRQATMHLGVIRLGHSYANTKLTDYDYVEAVPGRTYKIEFDYRTAPYLDTTQYPNWPTSNLEVGIAVADPSVDLFEGSTYMTPNAWKDGYTSYYEMIEDLTVTAGSCKPDTGWLGYELTFTVPENCDVTTNNALQIFFINGQRSGFYVDNVKVTLLSGINLSKNVNGVITNEYISDGCLTADDLYADGNTKWYTDSACTVPFYYSDYVRSGKVETIKLYGVEDNANVAYVLGDADADGAVAATDLVALRKQILSLENVEYFTRADANADGVINVRDIVRTKKIIAATDMTAGLTVGANALSSYKFDLAEGVGIAAITRAEAIANKGGMVDTNTNIISVGVDTALGANMYVIKVSDDAVTVKGGSANAVAAALESLIGYINAGVSVTSADSVEFVYNGAEFAAYDAQLVLEENF